MTDLEREYSPSSRVGGSAEPFIAGYRARSAAAAAELAGEVQTLRDGSLLAEAAPGAPLLVFVHGGYWQALSAAESLFPAPAVLALGWSYAAVEYTIAPGGALPQMIDECRAAVAALVRAGQPSRVVLAGHSAGAHLAAMVSVVRRSPVPVDQVVLISGVYDLRPLVRTTVNLPLGLDHGAAAELSPQLLALAGSPEQLPEVVLAWGDDETEAFKAQSRGFAARLAAAGSAATAVECPGRHHFDIVDDLADPTSSLGRRIYSWTV